MDTGEMGNLKRVNKKVEAVVLWSEENRASIVPITHVLAASDRVEGKTTLVKWRKTRSYPAQILKISDEKEVLQDYLADCLIGMGHSKVNTTLSPEKPAKKRSPVEASSGVEVKQRKLDSNQKVSETKTNKTEHSGTRIGERRQEGGKERRNSIQTSKDIDSRKPVNDKTGVSKERSRDYVQAVRYMNNAKTIDGAKELSILSIDEAELFPHKHQAVDEKPRSEIESSAAKTPVTSASTQRGALSQCRGDQQGATPPPCTLTQPLANRQADQIRAHVQKEHENQALIAKLRKEIAAKSQTISHLESSLQEEQNRSARLEATIRELKSSTIPDIGATSENVKFLDRLSGILKQKLKEKDVPVQGSPDQNKDRRSSRTTFASQKYL